MLPIKIRKVLSKYYLDFLNLGLLAFLSPLYFYKLDSLSLVSWDEAWYGAIARSILERGSIFILWWNGNVYSDHPPAGFWMIALSQLLLGANEFGTRAGSAVFALFGLLLTYLLGRKLFSKTVGFASAVALSSAYWYIYRARSGNLDIFLTVFFIATFYVAVKSVKNAKCLIPFACSFALLILTKSVIPLTIIPSLVIVFYGSKLKLQDYKKPVFIFLLVALPWFISQRLFSPDGLSKYFLIGAPGIGRETDYLKNFKQIKDYLHFGVGKWFWPGILGVLGGLFTFNRGLLAISVFCLCFFAPFILSSQGQLWHLIPLYPFMILAFFGFSETLSKLLIEKMFKKYQKILRVLLIAGLLGFSFYFSAIQIRRSWYEFIDIPKYFSDEAILSKKARQFPYDFYIDGSDFTPVAVFYSHKDVSKIWDEGLTPLFASGKKFVLITYQWRLDKFHTPKDSYEIIASDRDKILIIRK